MRFRIDGREIDSPKHYPLGQVHEAEKHLGLTMDEGGVAPMMIALYLSMRKDDPERHPVDIAMDVNNSDLLSVEEVEESPPADGEAAPEDPPTTGPRLLEASG